MVNWGDIWASKGVYNEIITKYTGSLGVINKAKEIGVIDKIRPLIDKLIKTHTNTFILSFFRSIVLSFYRPIVLSYNRSIVPSFYRSIVYQMLSALCSRPFALRSSLFAPGSLHFALHTATQFINYYK